MNACVCGVFIKQTERLTHADGHRVRDSGVCGGGGVEGSS